MKSQVALRVVAALAVALVPVALWAIANSPPGAGGFYPRCMLNLATGLHCPGCGGTRALHLAANGDFAAALGQNALLFLLAPFAVWYLVALARFAITGKWLQPRVGNRRVVLAIAIIVIGFGVIRNVPALGFLAPSPLPLEGS